MGHFRPLIGTLVLLCGLSAAACAGDGEEVVTEGRTDEVDNDQTSGTADAASPPTTGERSGDATSTSTTVEPTTAQSSDVECPDTTTTTGVTTSTGLPSVCEVIDEIPADELPAGGVLDYVVWSGTISGSIQTPGCEPVDQSGEIILVVFSDGDLSGAGQTVSGAYGCDNGASIPEMVNSYGIDGRMDDIFTLTFTDGVQLSSGPIEGGHALITQDTGAGVVTIELTCDNC